MRLADLNPGWLFHGGDGVTVRGRPVPLRDKVGVAFDCPCGCDRRVAIPFSNPPDGGPPVYADPAMSWHRTGDTLETLTLRPSILRAREKGGCGWHGHVTEGRVEPC